MMYGNIGADFMDCDPPNPKISAGIVGRHPRFDVSVGGVKPSSPNGARFPSEGRSPGTNGAPNQTQAPTGRNPPCESRRRAIVYHRCHPVGVNEPPDGQNPRAAPAAPWAVEFDAVGVGVRRPKDPAANHAAYSIQAMRPSGSDSVFPSTVTLPSMRLVRLSIHAVLPCRAAALSPNGARFHSEGRSPGTNGAPNQTQALTGRNAPCESRHRAIACHRCHPVGVNDRANGQIPRVAPSLFYTSLAATPRQLVWQVKQFSRLAPQPAKPSVPPVVWLHAACGSVEPDHGSGCVEIDHMERYLSHPNFPLLPGKPARGRSNHHDLCRTTRAVEFDPVEVVIRSPRDPAANIATRPLRLMRPSGSGSVRPSAVAQRGSKRERVS